MQEPESRFVSGHNGIQIHVADYGGDGAPLLLCHCTGTLARVWDPVVARLGGAFHVYAVDSRGHGDSDQPHEAAQYAWSDSGRDLLGVIDGLGLGSGVFAAGHSAGGAHVGYAELFRPGAFAKAMLIDAMIGPREYFQGENQLAIMVRRRRNIFDTLEAARERLGGKPPMNSWDPEALEAYLAHAFRKNENGQFELKLPGPIEAWVYENGGACDLFERLPDLQFPAFILAGGDSYASAFAKLQAQRIPQAQYHQLDNVGHFVPQEDPGTVARLLREWFS